MSRAENDPIPTDSPEPEDAAASPVEESPVADDGISDPAQDRIRIHHSPHIVIVTVAVIVLLLGVLLWANQDPHFPLILLVFTAGTLGGLLNTYRRHQLIISDDEKKQVVLYRGEGAMQIYMSPVIGGLFAIILYLLFLSGFLQGHLFPEYTNMASDFDNLADIFKNSKPKTNNDAVKMLFWAFVAGFSERYAPNLLSNVIKVGNPRD